MNAVEMKGITKQYPLVRAVDNADFCIRSIRHGKKNVWTCFCSVTYSGAENLWTECAELKKRWEQELEKGDEYYHPLLKKLKWM